MLTDDKVSEIFYMADEFCMFFDHMTKKYTIEAPSKRKYHHDSTLSTTEVMLIMILFHDSSYRYLKHFYVEHVCMHHYHLFPRVVSYNRFVELELHLISNEKGELLNFMITTGEVDDRKPLEYKAFTEILYSKLVGFNGYVSKDLFRKLFVVGIQLITKQRSNMKGALMTVSDRVLLRKRAIIETINDELKNIAQVEHSRHKCFDDFFVNTMVSIAAYCCFPKKPAIQVIKYADNQLTLF